MDEPMELSAGSDGTELLNKRARANASYGKACLSCVKSKARCAVSPSGEKCERCHRLNKDCQPAPMVRKKRRPKGAKTSGSLVDSRTAALEERLDGLVQMLQGSQTPQARATPPPSLSMADKLASQMQNESFNSSALNNQILSSSRTDGGEDMCSSSGNGHGGLACGGLLTSDRHKNGLESSSKVALENPNYSLVGMPPTPAASCASTSELRTTVGCCSRANALSASTANHYPLEDEAELEEILETYRTKMVAYFPIVIIKKDVTVRQLSEERPFLWLVIRALCSKNAARQAALGIEVRKVLGREILLEGTKTLDLLLGLLVFAAWGHFYIFNKPIISTIVQLSTSLAFDLGLTKPVPTEATAVMMGYNAQGCPKPKASPLRTMEERRAVIGLFFVSSVCSSYFQRIEHMRWTPYLDECLRQLEKTRDNPTDLLLVYLVRAQLISNEASCSPWNDIVGEATVNSLPDLYLKTLKSQLDDLKRSIPPELQTNETLQLHLLHTVLNIHEHSLIISPPKNISSDPSRQLQRLENIWTCFTTIKSLFEIFLSLDHFPSSCYPQISMAIAAQVAHCLAVLFRLSTFESFDVSWDRQLVRQELDLGEIARLLADRWGAVPAAAGLDISGLGENEVDLWNISKKRFLGIANWWETNVAAAAAAAAESDMVGSVAVEHGSGTEAVSGFGAAGQKQMETAGFAAANVDFLDDAWMRDLLAGEYEFMLDAFL